MISHLDHIVITVSNIEKSVSFYKRTLLAKEITFANGRKAVSFGQQKLNFQLLGQEPRNKAQVGSADFCLITHWSLEQVIKHLESEDIEILEGPVKKSGAIGEIESVYFCDPDSNLIEISVYK